MKLEQFQKDGRDIWNKLNRDERIDILRQDNDLARLIGTPLDYADSKFLMIHKKTQRKIYGIMKELGL